MRFPPRNIVPCFLVRQLGAERYLDSEMVAVLITLRQNLLAELAKPTAADIMIIDSVVVAYYNFLRTQHWIGDLSLVVERELFSQEPLNKIHGPTVGARLSEEIRRLAEVLLPLQERPEDDAARTRSAREPPLGPNDFTVARQAASARAAPGGWRPAI
jgi:hypothetical protein